MKSSEKIEKLVKKIRFSPSVSANQRILNNTETILEKKIDRFKSDRFNLNFRNLYMSRLFLKLAAAAIIIAAIIIVVSRSGFDGTSIALAQMLDTMKKQKWIFVTADINSPSRKEVLYSWTCFEPRIDTRQTTEETFFINFTEGVKYTYTADTNTIIIASATDKYNLPGPNSPFEVIEYIINSAEEQKANIKREKARINNTDVEIITLTSKIQTTNLVCDITHNLVISINTEAFDEKTKEKVSSYAVIEYPENGPKDIYSLAVPLSAAVVDNRPSGNVEALVNRIQGLFDKGLEDHIALVLESIMDVNNNLRPGYVIVMRQKGNLKRTDRYFAFDASRRKDLQSLYEQIKDVWPNLTIEKVLSLEDKKYLERRIIFDGKYTFTAFHNRNEMIRDKIRTDLMKINYTDTLTDLIWPNIDVLMMDRFSESKKIELLKEDPNHIGLVGFRIITTEKNKNQKYPEGTEPKPGTDDYWFDQDKNYMLVEHISKKEVGESGGFTDSQTKVIQSAQTKSELWYPVLIENKSIYLTPKGEKRQRNTEQRIILETNPVFAESTFTENFLE